MPVILNLSKNDKNILTNEKRYAIIVAKKEKNVYMRFRSEVLMLKISRKASVYISITLTVIFFLALIACAVIMPKISGLFVDAVNGFSKGETIGENGKIFVMTVGYLIVLSVGVADIMMFFLLFRVLRGLVFTKTSVSLIRGVSWLAIVCGILFALLGRVFFISYVVAVAILFLGLCIRVVKNVVEEATEIKNENDLTV